MDKNKAIENLSFIKEMIEKTRENSASSWKYLVLWGNVVILAIIGMYILSWLELYQYIWINWAFFNTLGIIIQIIIVRKEEAGQRVKTYAQTAISHLGFSAGIGYMMVGLLFPLLNLYSWGVIPILIAVITGIVLFTIGGIIEWNYFKICGLLWLISSLLMLIISDFYRALFFIPLLLISYHYPGYLLYKKYKKDLPDDWHRF